MYPLTNHFDEVTLSWTPLINSFLGSLISFLGSLGSNGPDLTLLNYYWTPQALYCKYACVFKIQRWPPP